MQDLSYAAVFELSPNPYLLLAPDLTILGCNRAYRDITGRSLVQLQGRPLFEAFPDAGESGRLLRESLQRALQTRRPDVLPLIRYDVARQTAAGPVMEERFWSATHTPVLDEQGAVRCLLQHTEDITGLHRWRLQAEPHGLPAGPVQHHVWQRAEAAERRHRELSDEAGILRQLFDRAPGFICVLRGPRLVFEMANRAYLDLIGRRDIIGRTVEEVLPELAGQAIAGLIGQVHHTGRPFVAKAQSVLLQRQPGQPLEERFMDLLYQPVLGAHGDIAGIVVQGHDVTEQCLAQQALQRHREALEERVQERTEALRRSEQERLEAEQALMQAQKMEALGKLTGGVAHDFNNVLQVIAGNLQLLRQHLPVQQDEAGMRRVQAALAGVDRGARLASHLLAFARKQALAPEALSPARLLEGMEDMLRRVLGAAVELRVQAADGLWNILADRHFLEGAVLNLAINGRDAMDGHGRLTIEAGNTGADTDPVARQAALPSGQYVVIAVSDTGSGMSAEVLQRAFEPFFTTKPEGQGTGLGLSMVYGFVKQSQGHIHLSSEPGVGTTVRLYLPRCLEAEAMPRTAAAAGTAPGGRETILVVEDDGDVRGAVVDTLTGLGYRVLQAADGQGALSVLQTGEKVDMLFADLVMPGNPRGGALAERARALQPDIEVLFTSGTVSAGEATSAFGAWTPESPDTNGEPRPASGAAGPARVDGMAVLAKPYRQEALAERIRHMLNNRAQVMELRAELDRIAASRSGRT